MERLHTPKVLNEGLPDQRTRRNNKGDPAKHGSALKKRLHISKVLNSKGAESTERKEVYEKIEKDLSLGVGHGDGAGDDSNHIVCC